MESQLHWPKYKFDNMLTDKAVGQAALLCFADERAN